jgi:epsilon-lactone hydrolase
MNDQINSARKDFDKLGTFYNKSEHVTINREIIENVTCYWFYPKEKVKANTLIIYLHGGCFVLGSIQSHQSLVSHVAEQLALPILFIEYSLAPEKPFPAAIDEIEKVYQKILFRYPENNIILMGDSAGGGLAISIISKFNKRNSKPPTHVVMLSPWIDLSCSNDSILANKDLDHILTKKALQDYASMYVDDHTLSEANPIENIYGKFPPTLILVSSGEILLDDSKSIYNKIASQQEKTKLSLYDNQQHVWILADIHAEASKKAIREIKEFISGK